LFLHRSPISAHFFGFIPLDLERICLLLKLLGVDLEVSDVDLFSFLDCNILKTFEMLAKSGKRGPPRRVHVHMVPIVDKLHIELIRLLPDVRVAVSKHLYEVRLELLRIFFDAGLWVCGKLPHVSLMRMAIQMAFPAVLVLALFAA